MGVFYRCSKCNGRTDNINNKNLCRTCEIMGKTNATETKLNSIESEVNCSNPCSFYFSVWCHETGYTQSQSWKMPNTTEIRTMQDAALAFVEYYDRIGDKFFAKNWNKIKNLSVWVQDWRGQIRKFEVIVEAKPVYFLKEN